MSQENGTTEVQEQDLSELLQIRRAKLDELRSLGVDPFGSKFERTAEAGSIMTEYGDLSKEELEEKGAVVQIAGRL